MVFLAGQPSWTTLLSAQRRHIGTFFVVTSNFTFGHASPPSNATVSSLVPATYHLQDPFTCLLVHMDTYLRLQTHEQIIIKLARAI